MLSPSTPILIGSAQSVRHEPVLDEEGAPQALMADAAGRALKDAGLSGKADVIDSISVIRTFAESAPQFATPFGTCSNYPRAIAKRIGARPGRTFYPHIGGNSPQMMVNMLAEDIRCGKSRFALIAGAEVIKTATAAAKAGISLDWSESFDEKPEMPGDPRPGISPHEMRHGLGNPSDVYPLYETALAHHYGRSMSDHRKALGALFSQFSHVAAENPYAAVPIARSSEEIWQETAENRMIAWPYTKYMNANMFVDQAAAVILTSVGEARAAGIPPDQWVFLTGSADISEKWFMSERVDFHSAPAIELGAQAALRQAGLGADDMSLFDIYSCFPVAVEIAADAIGLAHDDPRGLTVTGGLPFFGGPGNNYSLHAIAEMVQRLRARPGESALVTANGWYLTKHSFGVYSSSEPRTPWALQDPAPLQAKVDALPSPDFVEEAEGEGVIEASTVSFSRVGPKQGMIFGRLRHNDKRFLAIIPAEDKGSIDALMGKQSIGLPVTVQFEKGRNKARCI